DIALQLNKDNYISKMEEILSDNNTYEIINKDPTNKLTSDLRSLLVRWKGKKFIDDSTYRRLLTTDGIIPKAYGLTKIHKQGNPLRIIVSSINSQLYYFSLFLHNKYYLCHPRFQQNNFINAINIFLSNSYPLEFIFSSIQKRIKFHIDSNNRTVSKRSLRTSEMKILRSTVGKTRRDRVRNDNIRQQCNIQDIVRWGRERRRNWNQHISRMNRDRLVKIARDGKPKGSRLPGRPPKRCRDSWTSVSQEDKTKGLT
ncbi:hypothetical protein ALC60_14128, partial [Trachymyrmex zeteki]